MANGLVSKGLGGIARAGRLGSRLVTRPGLIDLHGIRIALPPNISAGMRNSFYAETYESAEVRALRGFLQPSDTVVELGASIGFVGLVAARIVGPDKLHMVEANADLIPLIRANFERNGLLAQNLVCGFASAGSDTHPVTFHVSGDPWTSSSAPVANATRIDQVTRVDVSELLRQTRATVLVCDIEGAEYDLLAGLDFHDLQWICMELHDHTATPEQRLTAMSALAGARFVPSSRHTNSNVFVFERV